LLARYATLVVDDDAFTAGLAGTGASAGAHSWAIGANWYPNQWLKWYATFEHTTFDEGNVPDRSAEDAIIARFQLAF